MDQKGVTENFNLKVYTQKKIEEIEVKKTTSVKGGEDERVRIVKKLAERFIHGCISGKQISLSFKEGVRVQELIETIKKEQI